MTGLDYAWNRYYSSTWGRFTSADPYQASGEPTEPQTWNRYSYVAGDPVNSTDPTGLQAQGPYYACPFWDRDNWLNCDWIDPIGAGGGGGGGGDWYGGGGGAGFQPVPTCPYPIPACGVWNGLRTAIFIAALAWDSFEFSRISRDTSRAIPTVEPLKTNCTPVGEPVIVPSTKRGNRDGGQSIEQEYECADGSRWTIHTLVDKNGKVLEQHLRPGGPKYGGRGGRP